MGKPDGASIRRNPDTLPTTSGLRRMEPPLQNLTGEDTAPRYPGLRVVAFRRLEAAAEARATRSNTLSSAGAERRSRSTTASSGAQETTLAPLDPSLGEE
jgi:hypothetical protein